MTVQDGSAGQVVQITSGEQCHPLVFDPNAFHGMGQNVSTACNTVDQSWGWKFNWTLRDGPQVIEQHQYMIFRYVSIEFIGSSTSTASSNTNNTTTTTLPSLAVASLPTRWSLDGWGVNAPWDPSDTSFHSSDNVLNAVWNLSANMLQKGVLDTYTDSNARERRAYECDGLIAAGNRMLLQSNTIMWARHSHSWIFQYPTWPVEWLQITPFLAHMDYMATGSTDLADAYFDLLYNNTQIHALDGPTGLINTSKPGSRDVELWNFTRRGGRHLVGWVSVTNKQTNKQQMKSSFIVFYCPHAQCPKEKTGRPPLLSSVHADMVYALMTSSRGFKAPAPITNDKLWMFSKSDFLSTSNFYTVRGLELLAELAKAAGKDVRTGFILSSRRFSISKRGPWWRATDQEAMESCSTPSVVLLRRQQEASCLIYADNCAKFRSRCRPSTPSAQRLQLISGAASCSTCGILYLNGFVMGFVRTSKCKATTQFIQTCIRCGSACPPMMPAQATCSIALYPGEWNIWATTACLCT